MFQVLNAMKVPSHFVRAIELLYINSIAMVRFGGSKQYEIHLDQGIKQGCPLSGTLWALLFDPIVRFIAFKVMYKSSRLSAYADDLAVVLHCLWRGLPLLAAAFGTVSAAATLELNVDKTILVPLFIMPFANIATKLAELCPGYEQVKIQLMAKYLGVMIGPIAKEYAWDACSVELRQRARRLKGLALPMTSTISYYNIYGASVCSHIAQFRSVSTQLRAVETAALASMLQPTLCLEGVLHIFSKLASPRRSRPSTTCRWRVVAGLR